MSAGLVDPQLGVAGGGAVDLADGHAEVPANDLHAPVGQVAELFMQEVKRGKKLAVVAREAIPQRPAKGPLVCDQCFLK